MPHYYSENKKGNLNLTKIKTVARGNTLELYTTSGIFSTKRIDRGTEILINECVIGENCDVLDFGCGAGVVGIAIKKAYPSCKVFLTDINRRAVKLAEMNAKLNRIDMEIFQGNLYEPLENRKFDIILSNPPQSAGRKLCFEIIEKAPDYLNPKGTLQLVVRHNKGGKVLEQRMKEIFGNVRQIVKSGGYRVYLSEKT
jgi:16S rRNA G1207 methylase RsmC